MLVAWQLADSAFPAGGLNHSQGLEAAMQSGRVGCTASLKAFAIEMLHLQAATSLPFVTAGYAAPTPESAAQLDAACEAVLCSNHVAKRASIAQGKGFLAAVTAAFADLAVQAKKIKSIPDLHGHLAPLFGIFSRKLQMSLDDTRRLYLFITLRSLVSAAIRLSICGPMQGQRMQADVSSQCIEPLLSSPALRAQLAPRPQEDEESFVWGDDEETSHAKFGAQAAMNGTFVTSPIIDMLQGSQDRLFTRLFSS